MDTGSSQKQPRAALAAFLIVGGVAWISVCIWGAVAGSLIALNLPWSDRYYLTLAALAAVSALALVGVVMLRAAWVIMKRDRRA